MPKIAALGGLSSRGFGEFAQQTAATYIEDVFSTYLYTGNASTQTITNGIDLSTKGGLVWIKERSAASSNLLFGTPQGTNAFLRSNTTNALTAAPSTLTSFNTDGFTLGSDPSTWGVNRINQTTVSWTFRKQPKFFDVITYTGNGVAGRTINHNLGSVPGMIIVKSTSDAIGWQCFHRSLGNTGGLRLDLTNANLGPVSWWNSTDPTATDFTIGSASAVNLNGATYVAYLFAHDAGGFGADGSQNVISCGSYVGNGSTSGPTVTLGYEPQWLLIKNTTTASSWVIIDNMRGLPINTNNPVLFANSSAGEQTSSGGLTVTATGFKQHDTDPLFNELGSTYIYMAIRRGPMRTPTSGTSVFSPNFATASSPWFKPGFPTDLGVAQYRGGGSSTWFADRLRGPKYLESANTSAEVSSAAQSFAYQNGWHTNTTADTTYISWNFGRAPGFFDVVCYTGTGTARTVSHNLGVAPELMIVKVRSSTNDWTVYHSSVGSNKYLIFNGTNLPQTSAVAWNNTAPTSTLFSVGTGGIVNASGSTYVAYLFATCPGVSKVGSYTGNGTINTISCGFTGGARYVLIKRTDSTGDWWVWDTARGMVAGTDPRLAYNSTAAETNANWVYTTTGGFQIVTSDATVNASGGTYIYLAIA